MYSKPTKRIPLWMQLLLYALILAIAPAGALISQATVTGSTIPNTFLPLVEDNYPYDWTQFDGNPSHTGNNTLEALLSSNNVGSLNLLFQVALPGIADGAPVYLSSVDTPSGVRDIVYVTTRDGFIAALDAHTGALLWAKQYGPAGCVINNNSSVNQACYTTSSPAIDPNRQFVYSYGLDGYVHKFAVGDGTETKTAGWPELTTLKPYDEKGSSALSIATAANGTSYLYVAHAGYPGDRGNYQGHVTAINLTTGSQKVFNTLCSNNPAHFVDSRVSAGPDCYPNTTAAVWARPGVIYDPYHDRILLATGNGTFQPGNFLWGDSVLSINPDGSSASGMPVDSYTPSNYQHLQDVDADLGSTAPAILPSATGKYPHLAVQAGKDAVLRLINLDQLSGQPGAGNIGGEVFSLPVPMGGAILTQPAVWQNPADRSTWVFVSNGNGLAALKLIISSTGDPQLVVQWTSTGGTSPLVANGVVFIARSNLISALNATNGTLLWSDNRIASIHWESPIVVKGVVYISDQNGNLTAYTLP